MTKTPGKQTVYVDVDEEITSIIDKVRSSKESVVALVLPKRATVFQSIVNMKLLKRAADQSQKNVVLVTSEAVIMPLAGAVGMHVAPNPNARPYIPAAIAGAAVGAAAANGAPPAEALSQREQSKESSSGSDSSMPSAPSTPSSSKNNKAEESIEIDNRPKAAAAETAPAAKKSKKNSKLKVPDFNRFRALIIIGVVALILLIIGGYWAFMIAPKATVTIRGETSETPLNFDITADTTATSLDEEDGIVPAKKEELKKTDTEKVPATGSKDNGTKAGGTVRLVNCGNTDANIPAGTGISSGSQTYIIQQAVKLDDGNFDGSGNCKTSGTHTATINVVAQSNGDQFNSGPRTYTVSGFSKVTAEGDSMSGGSSKVVKVVSAGDVETAKQRLANKQQTSKDELKKTLSASDYIPIETSFTETEPKVTSTPAVGTEANEVTVTSEATYTMIGLKKADVETLIKKKVGEKIDTNKQSILDNGLNDAVFQIGTKTGNKTNLTVQTTVIAGPEIDQAAISKEISGKKRGEAENIIRERPGIKDVRIDTKPFWNSKVPKKEAKITFVIEESDGTKINEN